MPDRKKVTEFIVSNIDKLLPDGFNKERTQVFLDSMSDAEFSAYMEQLGTEEKRLTLIAPNGAKVKLDLKNNLRLAEQLGLKFFEKIWLQTPDGKGKYLSHDKYLILSLPVRRQSQMLVKKASIPTDNKSVDTLTGQPAGKSASSKISFPEVQMLASLGLNETLGEYMKFRGGDTKGFHAFNTIIARNGVASLRAIEPYSGGVKSTNTLSVILKGMHLNNNLSDTK